jgi:hypothetical protein
MASWHDRLKNIVETHRGYEPTMRRSIQTCILYEAKRIVTPVLDTLRPFQRRYAFMDQALALLASLDFVPPQHKEEIMWRTMSSKEALSPDVAWKRAQLIDRELKDLGELIKPFCTPERTHEQACNTLVRDLYVSMQ